jgi:hypothetical protein
MWFPVVVKINIRIRCILAFFVGILFIIPFCTLADQVTDTRFMQSGAVISSGFSPAVKTVQALSPTTTSISSSTYTPSRADTRFKFQKAVEEGAVGSAIPSISTTTVAANECGTLLLPVVEGTMNINTGVPLKGIIIPQRSGIEPASTYAIPYTTVNSQKNVTKLSASGRENIPSTTKLPKTGSILLLNEAERELARMTSSYYTHTTCVDEKSGTYNYDCSGFVGYALSRAVPGAFSVLQHKRPVAADFYDHIMLCGPSPDRGGWVRVSTPNELLPGDVIVWLKPDASDSTSTGHIMIVSGVPVKNPQRTGEVLVQVIDSTESGHANDTRGPGETGLGKGTIGIMTDNSGLPNGYYWRGGESRLLQKTEIAFARIT